MTAPPTGPGPAQPTRRTFTPGAAVTLLAGAHPQPSNGQATRGPEGALVVAQGRTAAMLVELATNAHLLEDLEFGTVHLDLTPRKVTLRVERVCQPLHLAPGESATLAEPPGNA